ncbi:MAG: DUF885 domain-containing protein, partial [bacterium]
MRIFFIMLVALVAVAGCSQKDDSVVVESQVAMANNSYVESEDIASVDKKSLNTIAEEYYEQFLALNPIWATFNGDNRYDDRLGIYISPEYRDTSAQLYARYLEEIQDIDEGKLSEQDLLTYWVLRSDIENRLEELQYPSHLLPVNQMYSLPNLFAAMGSGSAIQPFVTVEDYENFLSRMQDFPLWVDQAIINMNEGIKLGIVQPRVVIERSLPQIESQIVDSADQSIFYLPIVNMPEDLPDSEREHLTSAYTDAIESVVIPAYKKLRDYTKDTYLLNTRVTAGLYALPRGSSWYGYLLRSQTTTGLSAEEIHQIGLDEVARIRGEMEQVKEEVKFAGSLDQFIDYMRSDSKFHFNQPDQLLDAYRSLKSKVDIALPNLFTELPEVDFEIRPVEEFRQRSAAAASYMPGSLDGKRPGVFYVNTYDTTSRPSYEVQSIYLHEAMPGHHFQFSLARQLTSLPRVRRYGDFNAYTEGWGLYAESLGPELGLYQDPHQYFGALGGEMLRAVRLVVDTGIHAMGWSRERAIEYMR